MRKALRRVSVASVLLSTSILSSCVETAWVVQGVGEELVYSVGSGSHAPPIVELHVANYGNDGVIVLSLTGKKAWVRERCMKYPNGNVYCNSPIDPGLEDLPHVTAMEPDFPPREAGVLLSWGDIQNAEDHLPLGTPVEIVWQDVALKDCGEVWRADEPLALSDYEKYNTTRSKEQLLQQQQDENERSMKRLRKLGYEPKDHVRKDDCTWDREPARIRRSTIDFAAIAATPEYRLAGLPVTEADQDRLRGSHYTVIATLIFFDDHYRIEYRSGSANIRRGITGWKYFNRSSWR